ncbi:hypothetical protein PENVUL_c189G05762 [Penicillium vulpinum]|uniref:Uncharacterized protein n=2 Tax=Penicillium vulpinum TaxID=29845 RepID=A0A1V6QVN5_9EURO|nr:hypothetical protein PENVUL_c189G05762 [Penicillium vulpinum]
MSSADPKSPSSTIKQPVKATTARPSRQAKRPRLVESNAEDEVVCLGTELSPKPTSLAPQTPSAPESPGVSIDEEVTFVESKPLSASGTPTTLYTRLFCTLANIYDRSAKYTAALSEAMHQGKVSQDWHEIEPHIAPPPMPPVMRYTLLNDAAFATQMTCYTRYKETLAAISRLEYERNKLTTRLWEFYMERCEDSADEQTDT